MKNAIVQTNLYALVNQIAIDDVAVGCTCSCATKVYGAGYLAGALDHTE
ncbi:MAG: hypothetical protein QNK37_13250 [Acidobacteriota bacterium]|nr:hypothetical protein [Acidobacteriota bacterium]